MMPIIHRAVAAPLALGTGWVASVAGEPLLAAAVCAALVGFSCTWPNLDDSRHQGRMHPFAAAVRKTARVGYLLRSEHDEERASLERGPAHCLEWCVLVGLVVTELLMATQWFAPWAWWCGGAVFIGCASNVLADLLTPSGVPLSALFNWIVYREVWRRHSLNVFTSDTGGGNFLVVPVLFFAAALMVLGMVGWLGPIAGWMVGIGS